MNTDTLLFFEGRMEASPFYENRIDIATEPYPNRWTHHVLVSSLDEIDEELMGWLKEAAVFASVK